MEQELTMKQKCLLITTKDNRKFLTHEKNLQSLIEYAKTFKSEISLVEVDKSTKILELKGLTVALCDPNYSGDPEYKQLKSIYPNNKRGRKSILTEAKSIREFIRKKFLSGKAVSLKEIKDKYEKYELTDACLCNHISSARKQLEKEGYSFEKIAAGKYVCKQNTENVANK